MKFNIDTGMIVSAVINYAAHLEKHWTKPGCIVMSDTVFNALTPKLKSAFPHKDTFEGRPCYITLEKP